MNEAKLILDIGADVTQFNYSLNEVRASIKQFAKEIESATGARFAELNVDITGLERTEDTLLRFSQFAEGTLGALKNTLATLKQERLEIPVADTARLEEYSRKIDDTARAIKNLENLGKQKVVNIIDPVTINSIEFFRQELDLLNKEKVNINIDTAEGRAQMAAINSSILYYQDRIKEANSLGQSFDPIPTAAINSINYFKQQIDKLKSIKASISIDTADGKIQIAELTGEIDLLENKLIEAQSIGKSAEFIDLNTLKGLQARLNEINKLKAVVNLTDEGEIARLNLESEQLIKQIARINSLGFDSQGQITAGAAKARQSITNFGLVLQDLPFGFIAIQNNIPNLIASFQGLQVQAKETGVSIGSILTQQFAGTAGAVLGVGLAVSALTSIITALIQQYGSLGAAIDAIIAKSISLADINDRIKKSYGEVTKSTAGEIANLKSLITIYTSATTSQSVLQGVKDKINKDYPTLIAFLKDENRLTEQSKKIIEERSKALFAQSILEGRRQGLVKLIADETFKGEDAVGRLNKLIKNELGLVETLTLAFKSLLVPLKAGPIGAFELLANDIDNASRSLGIYNNKLLDNNIRYAEVENQINEVIKAIKKEDEANDKKDSDAKKRAQERLSQLEQYRDALLKFNTLKIDVFEFSDDNKAIENKKKKLEEYGNVLLDTTRYDFERADALKKIIAIDQTYFESLNLEKLSLIQLKAALDKYIESLVKLQNIPKAEFGGVFDTLGKSLKVFTEETRIPTLFDLDFNQDQFDKIGDGVKNFTERTGITFDKWRQDIINVLTLTQAKKGFALSLEEIKKVLDFYVLDLNNKASELKLQDFLSGPAAEAQAKKSKKFFDIILKNAEDFEKTIENNLQRPFRDFFDSIIEEGKISFDSFFELFKDLIKRIASQLIASGIAKLISSVVFPTVPDTSGGFQKFAQLFFGAGGLLRGGIPKNASNNVNLGGVSSQGLQLSGEVLFVQRGSDLIGVMNRTNSTINRVG